MEQRKGLWDRIVEQADLPGEALPGQAIVELVGGRRVLVEKHCGITEYSCDKICVRVGYGLLCICGCGLELTRMTKESLVISGTISTITVQRRGRK